MKTRIFTLVFTALPTLAAFAACGGSSSGDGDGDDGTGNGGKGGSASGGSAGTSSGGSGGSTSGASSGGTPSKGGSAGTSPSGGDAGTTPTGGASGSAGSATGGVGGSAGSATGGTSGTGGGGRECETADDCEIFSDCCSCEAVPKGAEHAVCERLCIQDQCSALQIARDEVTCSFGRCVLDRSCNHALSTCDSLPPPCDGDLVRSLADAGCWGPCLPPTECRDVTDCSSCAAGDVCVIEQPQIQTYGCVRPDASCTKGNYCECLDACPTTGFVCMESDDAVQCPCPVC
jgi:hypothetical protein